MNAERNLQEKEKEKSAKSHEKRNGPEMVRSLTEQRQDMDHL